MSLFCRILQKDSDTGKTPAHTNPTGTLSLAKNGGRRKIISEITYVNFNINGREEKIFGFVIQGLAYDVILGKPWMKHNDVIYFSKERAIQFGKRKEDLVVREHDWYRKGALSEILSKY